MRRAAQVRFPYRHYRTDGDSVSIPTSPRQALRSIASNGLPMKINIETIPHGDQRYPTVGDYWDDPNGVVQVRVSDMKDWRYEALVVVHELIEMFLTKHREIDEQVISEFDIKFEKSREEGSRGRRTRRPRPLALSPRALLRNQPRTAAVGGTGRGLVRIRPRRRCPRRQEVASATFPLPQLLPSGRSAGQRRTFTLGSSTPSEMESIQPTNAPDMAAALAESARVGQGHQARRTVH